MSQKVIASAPGKIILSGEHTVVYGYPAIVTAVSLRSKITLEKSKKGLAEIYPEKAGDIISRGLANFEKFNKIPVSGVKISLDSDIPIGAGMGSSAAIAVSLSAALQGFAKSKVDLTEINKLANQSENHYHKNNSGVDAAICTYGGYLWYRKETDNLRLTSKVEARSGLDNLLIINSGKPKETTGEMVGLLADRYSENPGKIDKIFLKVEGVTRNFLRLIEGNTGLNIKDLIYENERYLEELGVVSDSAKYLIRKIEKLGGSAKISGAGGNKGASGMIIAHHTDKAKLTEFIKKESLEVMNVKFGTKGVQVQ